MKIFFPFILFVLLCGGLAADFLYETNPLPARRRAPAAQHAASASSARHLSCLESGPHSRITATEAEFPALFFSDGEAETQDAPGKMVALKGIVSGFDGKPMLKADVHLQRLPWFGNEHSLYEVEVKSDGSYECQVPPGRYAISFTGVNHKMISAIPMFLTDDSVRTINARLALNKYVLPSDGPVTIVYDSYLGKNEILLRKKADGVYSLKIDTVPSILSYEIGGAVEARTVNGSMADAFYYDGNGDYKSLLYTYEKPVTVIFDFNKLPHPSGQLRESAYTASVSGAPVEHPVGRAQKNLRTLDSLSAQYIRAEYGSDSTGMKKVFDRFLEIMNKSTAAIRSAHLPADSLELMGASLEIVHAKKLAYHFGDWSELIAPDTSMYRTAFLTLTPESPWWNLSDAFNGTSAVFGLSERTAYLERVLNTNPSEGVIAKALEYLVSFQTQFGVQYQDKSLVKRYVTKAKERVKDPANRALINNINPDKSEVLNQLSRPPSEDGSDPAGGPVTILSNGDFAPAISFSLAEDTSKVLSTATLKGKIYLIDFWATWCGPCLGELPGLAKAYEKYKDKGFEIVSLSIDDSPEIVRNFIAKKLRRDAMDTGMALRR